MIWVDLSGGLVWYIHIMAEPEQMIMKFGTRFLRKVDASNDMLAQHTHKIIQLLYELHHESRPRFFFKLRNRVDLTTYSYKLIKLSIITNYVNVGRLLYSYISVHAWLFLMQNIMRLSVPCLWLAMCSWLAKVINLIIMACVSLSC